MMYWRLLLLAYLVHWCWGQQFSVVPRGYRINYLFDLNPNYNYSFFGVVEIEFHAQLEPQKLQLQISNFYILDDHIKISGENTSIVNIAMQDGMLQLDLSATLNENVMYTLTVPFFGYGNSSKHGLNVISDFDFDEHTIVSAREQHYMAAFPVLEPSYSIRSLFTVSIAHSASHEALSNMPSTKEGNGNNRQTLMEYFSWPELKNLIGKGESDFVWTDFQTSKPMTTSMLGFVVTNAVSRGSPGKHSWNRVEVNVWRRDHKTAEAAAAETTIKDMFLSVEVILQSQYPLPKIDVLAIPDLDGPCLRVWGLVVCSEQDLLYDESEHDSFEKEKITERLARVVTSQWFGNMMVMRTLSQNWLTEGLTKYIGLTAAKRVEPEWSLADNYPIEQHLDYITEDALKASHSISAIYEDRQNLPWLSELTASKAYLLLRMNNILFSEDKFNSALTNFLSTYLYSAGDIQKLWSDDAFKDIKETAPKAPLVKYMTSWSLNEGYPALNITRNYDKNSITILQRRMAGFCPQVQYQTWWIPLSILVKNGQPTIDWVLPGHTETKMSLVANHNEWLIVNYNLLAPLRVNYDRKNWELLTTELMTTHQNIPEQARAQLVSDAFNFAWIGQLDYTVAFDLSKYLRRESAWAPFRAAFDALDRIDLMLQRKLEYIQFQFYIRYIISNIYNQNLEGLELTTNADVYRNMLQNRVVHWACHVHVMRCRESALRLFNEWLAGNDTTVIPSDVRGTVLAVGAALGGGRAWHALWTRGRAAPRARDRLPLLLATVHTTNFDNLLRTLDMVLSEPHVLRVSQRARLLREALRRTVNFPVIKNFIYKNTEDLLRILGPKMGEVIRSLASMIRNERDYLEFTKWTERKEATLFQFDLVIRQGKQIARSNINWDKKYSGDVVKILRVYQRLDGPKLNLQRRSSEFQSRTRDMKHNFYDFLRSMSFSKSGSSILAASIKISLPCFLAAVFCL